VDKKETVRAGFIIGTDVKDWYKRRAKSVGVSMSSLMAIALYEYKEKVESIEREKS